jgi:hypothetical protein
MSDIITAGAVDQRAAGGPDRPLLAVAVAALVVAAGVPLAVLALGNRVGLLTVVGVARVLGSTPPVVSHVSLVAAAAGCVAGPVAAGLSRVVPAWVVPLVGSFVLALGYLKAPWIRSVGDVETVLTLQSVGAAALLVGTAVLVGAAPDRTRTYLAAIWAVALLGTLASRQRLALAAQAHAVGQPLTQLFAPYRWLLVVVLFAVVLLAALGVMYRSAPPSPARADLLTLLPLPFAAALAVVVGSPVPPAGTVGAGQVGAYAGVLAAGLVAGAPLAVALARRGRSGAAGLVGAYLCVPAVPVLLAALALLRLYAPETPLVPPPGYLDALVIPTVVVAVLATAVGVLLPVAAGRTAFPAGLGGAAAGALALTPASGGTAASLPGMVLLAAGCGLALGTVARRIGPLAGAVLAGLVVVGLAAGGMFGSALASWRSVVLAATLPGGSAGVVGESAAADAPASAGSAARAAQAHVAHVATSQALRWLALAYALLLGGAAVLGAVTRGAAAVGTEGEPGTVGAAGGEPRGGAE